MQCSTFEHILCESPFLLLERFTYTENQYCWRRTVCVKWEGMNKKPQFLRRRRSSYVSSRKSTLKIFVLYKYALSGYFKKIIIIHTFKQSNSQWSQWKLNMISTEILVKVLFYVFFFPHNLQQWTILNWSMQYILRMFFLYTWYYTRPDSFFNSLSFYTQFQKDS